MKALKILIICISTFVNISFAQQKQVDKVVIKTPSVICEECQTKLEDYLKREPGIASVKVDYRKKTTTVTYLTDRNNIEQLKTAIANAGFDADDVEADEAAYKKLPKCCRTGDGKKSTAPVNDSVKPAHQP